MRAVLILESEGGPERLSVESLYGRPQALAEVAAGLRAWAGARGPERLVARVPEIPEAREAFAAAGYQPDDEGPYNILERQRGN